MNMLSNVPLIILLGLGCLLVIAAMNREHFVPEFLEQSNVKRTAETKDSSYEQRTNHVRPNGAFEGGPIQGIETQFRVNMFNSYNP